MFVLERILRDLSIGLQIHYKKSSGIPSVIRLKVSSEIQAMQREISSEFATGIGSPVQ